MRLETEAETEVRPSLVRPYGKSVRTRGSFSGAHATVVSGGGGSKDAPSGGEDRLVRIHQAGAWDLISRCQPRVFSL